MVTHLEVVVDLADRLQDLDPGRPVLGPDGPSDSTQCPHCSGEVLPTHSVCPDCGKQLADQPSDPQLDMETAIE